MPDTFPRTPSDLAHAIDRFVNALSGKEGQEASGLSAADLAADQANADAIRAALKAKDEAEAPYRAAVKKVEATFDAAEEDHRRSRRQASNHKGMTPELRAAAGLPAVADRATAAGLPTVADLTAVPRPSGAVFLDWTGPTGGSLRYEVFELSLDEDGGAWTLVGSATRTDFTYREAVPGARSAFRVEAVRGERRGEPSNEASVYA